ncbi:MAG: ABC transporter ATP-binding protein [Coriobacteriales bacterium]|jgi:ABC-2 type transport system ATP-binding protein|nr:ABC transporter ATP-binding protein [Coriobacteriales bacterium]
MSVIEISGLRKHFGRTQALDGVQLSVEPGEVYGFIGPNGAGKSTTIRALLGIIKADEGTARIFGRDCWRDAVEIHRRVAYVPGDVNLWPNLSGGEVIDLFLRLRGVRADRRSSIDRGSRSASAGSAAPAASGNAASAPSLDELIQRFDFDPSKKCGSYSKGNRQKVALIAAFASAADLYILDEPTSGLDPLMEQVFRQCVVQAKQRGATVFLSSHILSEVEQLCDRIAVVRAGRIIDSGSLDELRHLTRNKVAVRSAAPLDGLAALKGVHDLHRDGDATTFSLDNSETAPILAWLADKQPVHLTSTPPTLEELFMGHYAGH